MGLFGGLFGGSDKKAKEMDRVLDYAAAKAIEEGQVMKDRIQAGFEAQMGVLGMLGQPGTYSSPVGGAPSVGAGGITSGYSTGGGAGTSGLLGGEGPGAGLDLKSGELFKEKEISQEAKKIGYTVNIEKSKILDPEAFTKMVSKMPVSQIISRQVAEAQGLTDPQSPFRQSLEQSIKNPILEAGAETLRESQRHIKNQMAKGGSARRAALADAQQMLAIESSNRQVSQQLWQANLQFESWIRDYQRTAVNAAMAFTNGLGVQQYTNAMNQASQFMVGTALPTAVNMKIQGYQIAQQNKKKGLGELILGGVMMVAGMALGGVGGGLTGMLAGAAKGVAGVGQSLLGGGGGLFGGDGATPQSIQPSPVQNVAAPMYGGITPLSAGGYAANQGPWNPEQGA